jgi:hypothetical protein
LVLNYRRQQVGLQGALPGGQAEVTGSERVPLVTGAADSLKSFSISPVPQFGQATDSLPRTSNSKSRAQVEQRNSKRGIPETPASETARFFAAGQRLRETAAEPLGIVAIRIWEACDRQMTQRTRIKSTDEELREGDRKITPPGRIGA